MTYIKEGSSSVIFLVILSNRILDALNECLIRDILLKLHKKNSILFFQQRWSTSIWKQKQFRFVWNNKLLELFLLNLNLPFWLSWIVVSLSLDNFVTQTNLALVESICFLDTITFLATKAKLFPSVLVIDAERHL